ncbi:putative serine/threonine-protein kinase nek3 [Diplonema papillatum]|nr:putative serine/threonine-protein kinase nek3 [Diplonema papillatum]
MGNCMDSDSQYNRPANAAQPVKRAQVEYRAGDSVDAWWENCWYPASVLKARDDGSYDVHWDDGTMSYGVGRDYLRPAGPQKAAPLENKAAAVDPNDDRGADKLGDRLWRLLGGGSGPDASLSARHVERKLRELDVLDAFAWPRGRGDELTRLLCNRQRAVTPDKTKHFAHVKALFALVDKDKNNKITAWELETALIHNANVRAELGIAAGLAAPLFRQMDCDGSGWISFVEFFRYYCANPLGKKHHMRGDKAVAKRLFEKLDSKGTGYITLQQLRHALSDQALQLELGWPAHQANMLFEFLDTDRNGKVSVEELRLFMRVQLLFNKIDHHKCGFIDPFEFGDALWDQDLAAELGVRQDDAQRVFRQIDKDRSGTVTFAEFFGFFHKRIESNVQDNDNRNLYHTVKPATPADKYQVINKLGEGTFGIVYLIRRKADGLDLIMKKPKIVAGSNMDDVRMEADMLARLKHPHIIRFTEKYYEGDVLIIITEFVDGGDLRARINSRGCGQANTMKWFLESCDAVNYLHERYILHRDLKPDNIFLTAGGSVKVGDLGLATQLKHERDKAMTQCGTQVYMAPELLQGLPYDEKNDVWALGCILYEMATGAFAFGTVASIVRGETPRDTPRWCRDIVDSMLDYKPRDRPTVTDVLEMCDYDMDPTGMASYMSDRYARPRQGPPVLSPNDVFNGNNDRHHR